MLSSDPWQRGYAWPLHAHEQHYAHGQRLEVFWQREVDAQVLRETTWDTVGQRGFADPQVFGSHPNTLRWDGVTTFTSTAAGLSQPPLRAGIALM